MVTYTGGICGTFILFIFPLMLVLFARKKMQEIGDSKGVNFNASPFQSNLYVVLIALFSLITLVAVITGIFTGGGGE